MGVSIAKEDAVVTNLVGQLKAKDEQGNIRDLSIGDLIRTGEQLIFTTGTKFNLEYADGTRITEMSLAEPPLQTTTTPNTIPLPETGEQLATSPVAIDDEIAALQAQILAGDDPTAELPATAAGTAAGGSGNEGGSDYIALDRNADETIASSGYDTAGFTQPADTTLDEEIISELDPAAPSLTINNVTVSEQDLPQGSAPQPSAVTQNNNLFLTAEAGVFSLFINNVAVILDGNFVGPVTITTAFGSFTASSFDATTGELSYSYTLNSAAEHTATDQVLETLTVVLTDLVGNSDSGAVNITIVDDAPVGNDDNNQVTEDNQNSTSGNLLQNDTQGADSATVSQITNSIGQSLAVNGATEISGNFGTLVVEADGSYSYTLASQQQNVQSLAQGEQLTESFSYQLLDADGDSVTVNLSILITGSNDAPQITLTFDGADEGTVIESGNLDDGSFVAGTATVNGALTGSDVDNGAVITWSGSATGSYGNFNIDANSGQWSYSLDNQLADSLAEGQSVTEQFLVTLTDEFGATDTQLITITVLGTNDSPVITSSTQDAQGTVVEAGNLDDGTFVPGTPSTGGVLTASDVDDGASLSWSGSAVGNFGSFTVEAATGIWSYTLDNQAADSLAEGEVVQEQFLVTVIDEFGATATQLVTVTIEGTNDSPVITSTAQDATGTVTESGVDEQGNPTGIATATGLLTASDVDNNAFLTWSGNATGDYGSFSIDALTGEWVYNLDNDLVDELALGETRIEQFLVTVTDEFGATDTQLVTITIEGTNDIPSLTVDAVGSVTEDATDPNLSDSGALSFTDVDVINTHSVTESYNSDISWSGGDLTSVLSAAQIQSLIDGFSVDSDSWDYSILNSLVQFLAEDESINLSFDVSVTDNNGISDTKTVAITINGTNDLPVLTVDAVGGVTEDATDPNLSDSGALSFTDVDVNNTHSVTESYNSDISWSGGDLTSVLSAAQIQSLIDGFSVDNDSWDYSILNSVVQFLALGETVTLSFDVTVTDNDGGSDTKTVAITISGTNDLPVLTVDAAGGVTEDATNPNLTDSGALSFTDVDVNNTHSVSEVYNSDISWSGGDITSVLSAAQIQSLIDGFSVDSDSWDYSILNSVVQFLALGETITLSFDVTVTDNDGGSDTKTVAITINGTNDQPVLSVDAAGGVTEDATDPNLSDSGALSFTDVDVNNTHSVSEVYNSDISWSGGDITSVLSAAQIQSLIDGFSVDSDSWDYSILNSVVQFLALGESINLSFDVTVTDNDGGSDTKTVAITINGTNDDPVLSVDMVGGVTEDATDPNLTDSGALSFTDVDVNNTHSVSEIYNSDISWSGGDLTSVLSAAQIQSLIDGFSVDNDSWDYSILNSVVQFLALGESINLSFDVTVTDSDGGSDTKTVAITINGTNDLPVLSVDMVGGVTEDATNPNLTDSGALSFTDVDVNNTHSVTESYNSDISWSGGDITSVLSAAQIQSLIDGFSVDSDSWDYSILNSLVQFLALGETVTLSFDVTVTDNDGGSDTKTVAITISGTNDDPVLSVDAVGGVTEDATNPNLTDSGALSFTDVDVNNTHSVTESYNSDISWSGGDLTSVLSAAQIQSLIDGFSIDNDSWDYSILNSVVQFLALGESINLSFDVTVTDNDGGSDTKTVAITINGTNDLPVLSVDMVGAVTEDATNPNLTDSGALSFTDVDVNNTHSVTESYNSDISWSGGDITSVLSAGQIQSLIDGFSVDSDSWDYSILNSLVQFLALGETVTLSFDVTVTDNDGGSDTKTVAITINGTNDDPVLSVDAVGGVTEDATDPNLTDSGALSFTDVDVNNTHSVTESYNSDISWSGGDLTSMLSAAQIQSLIDGFSIDNDSWDYSILNSLVQFLALGESINLSFDVTVTDNDGGSDTKTVAITISGTNDDPVLSVDMVGGVTEDATDPNLTDSGALSFTDVDVNNTHSVTESYNSDISWSGGDITSVLSAAQIQSLIDGFSVDSDSWDYSILNSLVQFLALGETVTLSFDVTVTDNDGGSDTKTVAITINGTNDDPVLSVDAVGGVTEDATDPNLTDSGALSFIDVDVNNTHSVTESYNSDISWSGGDLTSMLSAAQIQSLIDGFSVDNDSWDYSILNSLVQFLAEDETITLSFDVTVTDNDGGSDTKTVVITINGNNDPVEGEFTKEIWVPASFDELVIPYADGYPLNIAPPTDTDSNDTLTITVTGLPEFGTVGYYDGNVFIELTNNMELTSEQLANLIYVPVGDDLAHDMSLTFDIQSGSEVVQAEFIIHTAPPASLPGQTVQIGDGSSPLTSGNDQESQLILTTEFANNLANNPGLATLQLFTDFQKSPFATPIPGDEIGGTTGDKRESEVSIRLTINGIVFVVLEAANGIADWFYDPDSGLMKANFDYSDIYQEGHVGDANFSLLNYLSNSYTPTGGDIWTVTYLDNDGGSYQARFLQANFVFDNTGDPSITVTGTDNVDNLIFGGTSGDTLTGANLDDRIFGREGDDTIIGLDGDDELLGGAGDDTLSGGLGNDYLVGGPGNDSLDGGVDTDKDTFVWDVGSDDGSIDSVYNFDSNYDVLDLSDVLVDEENFSLEDYLNFNFNNLTNSTEIYVDSDRDGNIDLTIVLDNVNLNNTNTLTDIQVINNLLGDNALIVDTIP